MSNEIKIESTNPEMSELARQWRAQRGAPPSMEATLLAEFRVQHQAGRRRRYLWWSLSAAAVASLVFSSVALLQRPTPQRPVAPVLLSQSEAPSVPTGEPTDVVVAVPARVQRNPMPKQPEPNSRESYTEFFPITNSFSRDQLDRGQVIRVQMPRSALFTIGMPVDVNRLDESIKADLVMGEDGIARAVRFVQ